MPQQPLHKSEQAGLLRRLVASLYDWLLVLAVVMVLSVPLVAIDNEAVAPGNPFYRAFLIAIAAVFFAGFWSTRAQTLGMRAWRIKIETTSGEPVTFGRGLLRFFCACLSAAAFGLGFLWVVVSPAGMSWHDSWSGTRLRQLPKTEGS